MDRWLVKDERDSSPINKLPMEVLDMIMKFLSPKERTKARLVCKLWYDSGHFYEKLRIVPPQFLKSREARVQLHYGRFEQHHHLENCGFQRLNLHFHLTDLRSHQLPVSVWENVGVRIHSIQLYACRLDDEALKNLVLNCENLQIFEIGLGPLHLEESICSLDKLKASNVVRKKLHTLKIYYVARRDGEDVDVEKWKTVFRVLRQVYPNVTHYDLGSGLKNEQSVKFKLTFSLECARTVDELPLIDALGNSMAPNKTADWTKALNALSAVRLASITLVLGLRYYTAEDVNVLLNFFSHQKRIKKIHLTLLEDLALFYAHNAKDVLIPPQILTSILFHILDKCPQLREFYFFNDWFSGLEKTHYAQVVTKTSRLTKFLINDLIIDGSTIQKRTSFPHDVCLSKRISFVVQYSHVQHLVLGILELNTSDIDLICQYMTNLKTLEINVTNWVFQKDSFKRLRNLERLTLHGSDRQKLENRDWYEEFEFPKLRYLYCFLPEEASLLDCIGTKLPVLEKVDFSQTDCVPTDYFEKCSMDITCIFERCPTLTSFHYCLGIYYLEPFTQKVIFTKTSHLNC